jgi:RNA polymerase sigma-70 factor (ECF subfamily)
MMGIDERAEEAKRHWPDVPVAVVPEQAFAMLLRDADASGTYDADLYLACACAHGAPTALAAFERSLMPEVPGFLARMRPTPTFVDEVQQLLRAKLFTGATPKICEYSGTGPLAAWLRVTALRTAIDLKRTRGEQVSRGLNDELLLDLRSDTIDVALLKAEYRPVVAEAFRTAVAKLESKERNLLRLHFVDELTFDEIGRLFQVNRSTAFRWIDAAREELVNHARAQLRNRIGLDATEFESLVQLVRSQLDLSLSRLLR